MGCFLFLLFAPILFGIGGVAFLIFFIPFLIAAIIKEYKKFK